MLFTYNLADVRNVFLRGHEIHDVAQLERGIAVRDDGHVVSFDSHDMVASVRAAQYFQRDIEDFSGFTQLDAQHDECPVVHFPPLSDPTVFDAFYDISCGQYFREDEGADSHVFKKGFVFFVQVFRIVDTGYCFLRSQCMGQHATGDIFHFVGHDGDEQFGMCGSGFFQAADRSRFYIEGHEVYVVGDF